MATLAELLRQGADKLVNLPSEAQRFITNPQAFTQLLTGKNPLPRETGFAAGATGLPAQEMSVLDPNQAPYMQGYTQGEPIGYAGMAAPFAAPAAVATAKALAPKAGMMAENYMVKQGMIQPLTAYHGTPHTIQGQFDINKVGTGEGNQTFGYGMYFAEEPKVAKMYQASLSDTKYLSGGKELKGNEAWAAQFLHDFQGDALPKRVDVDTAISKANQTLKDTDTKKEIINNIKALDKSGLSVENGNLYKVDIPDADIPMMLDWDKPLLQQTPQVQEALAKLGIKTDKQKLSQFDDALLDALMNDANKPLPKQPINPTGQDIYQKYVQGNPQLTSQKLNEVGIRGIRYLDEGSRVDFKYNGDPAYTNAGISFKESNYTPEAALEGMKKAYKNADPEELQLAINDVYGIQPKKTSNFVVFDPSNVKILEQNNKPVTRKELIQEQIDKIE